jgi:hypothetical protein
MPQSGLWRKKLLAIKFCAVAVRCLPMQRLSAAADIGKLGGSESLTFPL